MGARRPSSRRWTRARPSCAGRPTMVRMGRAARCAGTAGAGAGAAGARRCLTIPRQPFWDSYSSGSRAGVVRRRGLVLIPSKMDSGGQRAADSGQDSALCMSPAAACAICWIENFRFWMSGSITHASSVIRRTSHNSLPMAPRDASRRVKSAVTASHAVTPFSDSLLVAVKHCYRYCGFNS